MNPEHFRHLALVLGTQISIVGDDCPPEKDWINGKVVLCQLESYIVIERRHNTIKVPTGSPEWDTALIASTKAPLKAQGYDSHEYIFDRLLLIQRHPECAWNENQPTVHVYGILPGECLEEGPLNRNRWENKTAWLSSAAVMSLAET